ncbi:MAG: hypothetical protein LBM08_05040 [Dysgonamonadaceae bacterium]|jgi:hypothetical protein|nr:hypothetical protein [Dysgonamonadaceae bacterium]
MVTNKPNYIIGIDPDTSMSGVASLEVSTRKLKLESLALPLLLDYLQFVKREKQTAQQQEVIVVVEAGWLNTISNYHTAPSRKGQRISKNVGSNHQVGKMIVEMCKHYGIPVELMRPLRKIWKGKDGKITQEELAAFTGITGRNNQEERDAALIAWGWAGLGVRV